jgi:hypothetical protein
MLVAVIPIGYTPATEQLPENVRVLALNEVFAGNTVSGVKLYVSVVVSLADTTLLKLVFTGTSRITLVTQTGGERHCMPAGYITPDTVELNTIKVFAVPTAAAGIGSRISVGFM